MPAPATHALYGGSAGEFTADIPATAGEPITSSGVVTLTVWDGGAQLTDIYDASGNGPVASIQTTAQGGFAFYALDTLGTVHVSPDDGVSLYPVQPALLGDEVQTLRTDVDGFTSGSGIPVSEKGTASGVATLDASSKIVQSIDNTKVDGLSDQLAAKAAAAHGHESVDVTGLSEVAQTGQYLDLLGAPGEKEKVLLRSGGVYPTRGTPQMAHYKGTVAPAVGGANAVDGDLWTKTLIDFPAAPA